MNKKIRHSKFKNTGLIFEILMRQLTADILNGKENPKSLCLIKEYFSGNNNLTKELELYNTLLKEKFNSELRAKDLIEAVISARKKIVNHKLRKEKYNLIKEIKRNYDIDSFFRSRIADYKILASIYKLFEHFSSDKELSPADEIKNRYTLIENITSPIKKEKNEKLLVEKDKDLRILAYKIMVDKFNEKYNEALDDKQKNLLREYIHNISNTNKLREYVDSEIESIRKELEILSSKVSNEVTKIKLGEVISQIDKLKQGKIVKDNQIASLMKYYQLLRELRKVSE